MSIPGYDRWKLRSDRDDGPQDECCHEEAEIDILTGRSHCCVCGETWWVSDAEINRHYELMRRPYPDDEDQS